VVLIIAGNDALRTVKTALRDGEAVEYAVRGVRERAAAEGGVQEVAVLPPQVPGN